MNEQEKYNNWKASQLANKEAGKFTMNKFLDGLSNLTIAIFIAILAESSLMFMYKGRHFSFGEVMRYGEILDYSWAGIKAFAFSVLTITLILKYKGKGAIYIKIMFAIFDAIIIHCSLNENIELKEVDDYIFAVLIPLAIWFKSKMYQQRQEKSPEQIQNEELQKEIESLHNQMESGAKTMLELTCSLDEAKNELRLYKVLTEYEQRFNELEANIKRLQNTGGLKDENERQRRLDEAATLTEERNELKNKIDEIRQKNSVLDMHQ